MDLLKQDADLATQLETEVRLALSEFGNDSSTDEEKEQEVTSSELGSDEDPAVDETSEKASVDSELYLE